MTRWRYLRVVVLVALIAVAGCGSDDEPDAAGTLHVFAASSLTEAFTELGAAFERDHPDVSVEFSFAASSTLALQIDEGAPADVFVSADEDHMRKVVDAGDATDSTVIARNRLAILVEKGNPKRIRSLADLAKPDTIVVLCAPEVPCGTYAAAALAKANVTLTPASLEENVKAVVTRVSLGEADAGIVYATDVTAATDAEGVPVDNAESPDLLAAYPAAVLTGAENPALARAWVEYLTSDGAQRTLAGYGFLSP
jgi:molybdate transport system substrate-binding protein